MQHKNRYPVWPNGWRKKESGLGPLSGLLIEEYDATSAFDPMLLTIPGNPWGVPNFLWKDPDGATPTLSSNPLLSLSTVVGTPVQNYRTPYQYPSGTDETCEQYDGSSYRYDGTHPLVWSDTDDVVFACKWKTHDDYTASTDRYDIWSNQIHASSGMFFFLNSADNVSFSIVYSPASTSAGVSAPFVSSRRTWHFSLIVLDRSTETMYGWFDGQTTSNWSAIFNNLAYAGRGICLGARMPGGAVTYPALPGTCISWIGIWSGADLYEQWSADSDRLARRLTWESLGLRETQTNTKYFAYSHPEYVAIAGGSAGSSYMDHNGVWWFTDRYVPVAGNPNGAIAHTFCYNRASHATSNPRNVDPAVTTAWTVTGGTLSVVSDAAALATAKADIWGPNVFYFQNTSGSTQVAYVSSGGTNCTASPCHFHLLARYNSGSNALIGFRDGSSGVFTSVGTILDNYALTEVYNQTPPDTDCRFAIQLPNNTELYFIAHSLNNYTVANNIGINKYPIPCLGTAGMVYVYQQADYFITEHTPSMVSDSALINVAPLAFSGTAVGADTLVLQCVTTPGDVLHVESAAPGWATSDGTTQIQTGTPTAGSYAWVWSAWQGALQYVQEGLLASPVTGAYDGNKGTAGALEVGMTTAQRGGDMIFTKLQIRQI